jgi:hypothetical protein
MSETRIVFKNDSMGEIPDGVLLEESTLDVTLELESDGSNCQNCGEKIAQYVAPEYSDGWVHEWTSNATCHNLTDQEILDQLDVEQDHQIEQSDLEELEIKWAEPYPESPADWANWVGVTVSENRVQFQLSVADPRGCMTVDVVRREIDGKMRTVIELPSPDDMHTPLMLHTTGLVIEGS